jgi:hypothetical protein
MNKFWIMYVAPFRSFIFFFTNHIVWTWDVDQRIHVRLFLYYIYACVGIDVYAWCRMVGHEMTAGTINFTLWRLAQLPDVQVCDPCLSPTSPLNRTPHSHDMLYCDD